MCNYYVTEFACGHNVAERVPCKSQNAEFLTFYQVCSYNEIPRSIANICGTCRRARLAAAAAARPKNPYLGGKYGWTINTVTNALKNHTIRQPAVVVQPIRKSQISAPLQNPILASQQPSRTRPVEIPATVRKPIPVPEPTTTHRIPRRPVGAGNSQQKPQSIYVTFKKSQDSIRRTSVAVQQESELCFSQAPSATRRQTRRESIAQTQQAELCLPSPLFSRNPKQESRAQAQEAELFLEPLAPPQTTGKISRPLSATQAQQEELPKQKADEKNSEFPPSLVAGRRDPSLIPQPLFSQRKPVPISKTAPPQHRPSPSSPKLTSPSSTTSKPLPALPKPLPPLANQKLVHTTPSQEVLEMEREIALLSRQIWEGVGRRDSEIPETNGFVIPRLGRFESMRFEGTALGRLIGRRIRFCV